MRYLVAGSSGSGKTTVARRIAAALDIPRVELDALFHGPGWTPRPTFVAEVDEFSAGPSWVTEFQYEPVREMLAARADVLVWLDLPRLRVMTQVTRRTLSRAFSRSQLWNGNVEPPLRTFFTDRDHIIRWAWRTHPLVATRVATARSSHPGLGLVRLRSHREVDRWIGTLSA